MAIAEATLDGGTFPPTKLGMMLYNAYLGGTRVEIEATLKNKPRCMMLYVCTTSTIGCNTYSVRARVLCGVSRPPTLLNV